MWVSSVQSAAQSYSLRTKASLVSSHRPAPGQVELHVAAHRVRRAVDDQQQRLVLCFLAEGVSRARDDAQNTQHVARRGEHGDLAARERRVRVAQGRQLRVPLQHLRVAHLQRRARLNGSHRPCIPVSSP